jgi:hypothetical protein
MPEHEIAKHTESLVSSIRDKRKNWKEKLGEIIIEIFIIVFAITLSLLVERWRENSHNREVEKKFLIGLKHDLQSDLNQQKGDSISYATLLTGWNYLRSVGLNDAVPDKDSMNKYRVSLLSTTDFIPNDSRFEALKSSGSLGDIENDSLQDMILDLYQDKIKTLQSSTLAFTTFKELQFFPFLRSHVMLNRDGTRNFSAVLRLPEMQNDLTMSGAAPEILDRYHKVMQQSRLIIDMINKQYRLK